MEIVSISLDGQTLGRVERARGKLGFGSRSQLMRAALISFLEQSGGIEDAAGHSDAVFTVAYERRSEQGLSALLEAYGDIIRTEIHQHHEGTCLRVLILCGQGERLRGFADAIRKLKAVKSLNIALL